MYVATFQMDRWATQTSETVLIREVSLFQRCIYDLLYMYVCTYITYIHNLLLLLLFLFVCSANVDDKEEEREERRSKTLNVSQAPAEFKLIEKYSIVSIGGMCHSQCVPVVPVRVCVCVCVCLCVHVIYLENFKLFVVLQLINPLLHIEI